MLSDQSADAAEFAEILSAYNELAPVLEREEILTLNSVMAQALPIFGASPADLPAIPFQYIRGKDTTIITSQRSLTGFYALVALEDLIPSHNPKNFAVNPLYPLKCQQRDYTNDAREQYKVTQGAKDFNADFVLADSPTATDGAPIVTYEGFVLGGNGRTMMMQLLSSQEFENKYRTSLLKNEAFRKFGFTITDTSEIAARNFGTRKNNPNFGKRLKAVVVRMVDVPLADCALYSNILNTNLTQSVDITTKTVSYARQLSRADIESISETLAAQEGETLASILSTPKIVQKIYNVFFGAGIITQGNMADWMDSKTEFTSVGKKTVEGVLLGVILDDKELIESARSFTEKFIKTLPLLLRMKRLGDGWDMTNDIIHVIRLESSRRAAKMELDHFLNQITFDRPEVTKKHEVLWRIISDNSWYKWKNFLSKYIEFGEEALRDAQSGGNMFGEPPLTPEQALARLSAKGLSDSLADYSGDREEFLAIIEMYKGIASLLTEAEIVALNAALEIGKSVWGVDVDLPVPPSKEPSPAPIVRPRQFIATSQPSFTYEEFAEIVRPDLLASELNLVEQVLEEKREKIAALDVPPASWTETKSKWLDTQTGNRERLALERDIVRAVVTRVKNDRIATETELNGDSRHVEKMVEKYLRGVRERMSDKSHDLFDKSNGTPTPEQMARYIKHLEDTSYEKVKGTDYYPTPFDVVARMIAKANLLAHQTVLEPSAGKGDIADALRALNLDLNIDTIELAPHNRRILELKGYNLIGDDFLNFGVTGKDAKGFSITDQSIQYDRIVMNPPFQGGMDWLHILHAMKFLKPQGELVAIVPAGAYLSNSQEAEERRVMIEETNLGSIEVIRAADYNKNLEFTQLSIDLAIITMVKTERRAIVRSAVIDFSADSKFQVLPKIGTEMLPERTMEHIDTGFVKPQTVMAQAELVPPESSVEDYVSRIQTPRPLNLFDYQRFGCNLAIKALCHQNTGNGFLLADGTGAGKTIEMLTIAAYTYQTYKKPVVIFTVDDRVMKSSFMKDAVKLGFYVPEYTPQGDIKPVQRPANYKGLYDKITAEPTPATSANSLPTVYIGQKNTFKLHDGINIFKYNQLSDITLPVHIQAKVTKAENDLKASNNFWTAILQAGTAVLNKGKNADVREWNALEKVITFDINEKGWYDAAKKDWKNAVEAARLDDSFAGHKRFADAVRNLDKYKKPLVMPTTEMAGYEFMQVIDIRNDAIKDVLGEVMGNTSLVIFDEAHKIKNLLTNDDIQASRAYYAKFITDTCARVLFATATPNDRAYDILYLKRCGIFENDEDFVWKMASLGIEYKEAKKDSQGRIVRVGRWVVSSNDDEAQRDIINFRMGQFFKYIVRQGCMIRREIQYTNLTARFTDVIVPSQVMEELAEITLACTKPNAQGKPQVDRLKKMQRHLEHMEAYKIEEAIRITQAEIAEGRSVLIFTNYVDEGEEVRKEDNSVKLGTVRILKNRLSKLYGEDAVGVLVAATAGYEDYKRLQNVDDFQTGKKRILIGTITSGGTGVNLDDTTGNAPRTVIIMTAPLSFINVMQGIGRVVRANSASRSRVQFLFAKTDEVKLDADGKVEASSGSIPIERWLKKLIGYKFKTLKAAVEGEIGTIDPTTAENMEAGGADAVAWGADNEEKEEKTRNHSMYTQTAKEVDGRHLPSRIPLIVSRHGNSKEHYVTIRGATRDDFNNWVQANKEFIEKWGLTRNVDINFQRYNGNHYGLKFEHDDRRNWVESRDVWNALLNQVKQEDAKYLMTAERLFAVGDEVRATTDLTQANAKTGTVGTIIGVMQVTIGKNESGAIYGYEYDVQFPQGKAHGVVAWQIASTTEIAVTPKYKAGQMFIRRNDYYGHERIDYISIREVKIVEDNALYKMKYEFGLTPEQFLHELRTGERTPNQPPIDGLTETQLEKNLFKPHSGDIYTEYDPMNPVISHDNSGNPNVALSDQFTVPQQDELPILSEAPPSGEAQQEEDEMPQESAPPITPEDLGFYDHSSIMNIRPSYMRLNRMIPLLEKIAKPFRMLVWGKQGSGKSSLTLMLAEDMSLNGKVLHVLTEEKIASGRIGERVKRLNINARKIMFNDQFDYARLRDFLTKNDSVQFVIVDSINQLQGASEQLLMDLWNEFPTVSFVFVGQSTKDGKNHSAFPTLAFNVDTEIKVEDLSATAEKHRDGRTGVQFDILGRRAQTPNNAKIQFKGYTL